MNIVISFGKDAVKACAVKDGKIHGRIDLEPQVAFRPSLHGGLRLSRSTEITYEVVGYGADARAEAEADPTVVVVNPFDSKRFFIKDRSVAMLIFRCVIDQLKSSYSILKPVVYVDPVDLAGQKMLPVECEILDSALQLAGARQVHVIPPEDDVNLAQLIKTL